MDLANIPSLSHSLPTLLLAFSVVAVFLLDLVIEKKEWLGDLVLIIVAVAIFLVVWQLSSETGALFHRSVALDEFGMYFQLLILLSGFATIWMSLGSREVRRLNQGEYWAILLAATLGMTLMATATNLLMAYLSLEFVSLTSYVLAGYSLHSRRAGEASLKYLIYGGVASGAMIYGMSWIYGLAGTLDFHGIQLALAKAEEAGGALPLYVALILTVAGLGFKISAFPFHMWAPDVYQGAPIPVAAFLAVGSKTAAFALMIRFFFTAMSQANGGGGYDLVGGVSWHHLLMVLSILTMTYGNLAALNQQSNVKRLLAYSGIAHAGYALMGFVVLTDDGLRAMIFYLTIYYLMNIGAFLVVMMVANSTGREDLAGFKGLAWRGGALPAIAMAIFMFSLTGLPPLGGFIGKFYLFAAVVQQELYLLAVIGVLNSVISLFYYAKIVRTMFLEEPTGGEGVVEVDLHNGFLLGLLTIGTVVLGIFWGPLFDFADRSTRLFIG